MTWIYGSLPWGGYALACDAPPAEPPRTDAQRLDDAVMAGLEWAREHQHELGTLLRDKAMRALVERILEAWR